MQSPTYEPPTTVRLSSDRSAITLGWPQASAMVTAAQLREACRCAWCKLARHRGEDVGTAPRIVELTPMGGQAVHIVFSDGHRTGVFPWTFICDLAGRFGPVLLANGGE